MTLHGRILDVSRLATVGEMAAGIAHELNQPLTAIANYAQACERLLERPQVDLADFRTAFREITAQAVRAAEILRRLRSLTTSAAAERMRADINDIVTEMQELMQSDARSRGVSLQLQLAQDLPHLMMDRVQIQHALLNLVHNAIEAVVAGGTSCPEVRVHTSRTDRGDLELAVYDNGPGVAPEAGANLFDPFFSTKSSGTGLGLPIVNTVVRAHGGVLGHRPNAPQGACFYIRLPIDASESSPP